MLEDLLTTTEAAEVLGITPARIRHFVTDGRLSGVKRANAWFFKRSDVEALKRVRETQKEKKADSESKS